MSELLGQWVKGEANRLLDAIRTPGSSEFTLTKPIQVLCFSGGVADCIYNVQDGGWNRYRDMGVVLGQAIRSGAIFSDFRVMDAKETIRATVVGAGSYTTSVSGSTITYNRDVFPLKNIPVLKLSGTEQETCFSGSGELLSEKIKWMQNQGDTMEMILAMKGKPNPSYTEVKRLAEVLVTVLDSCLPEKQPMIIVLECDMAKALGQMMLQISTKSMRDVICIDSIQVDHNDFVDMGKPLVDGLVIPVVVKTLIFG
jgi:ethanolamine utilization protein EutA